MGSFRTAPAFQTEVFSAERAAHSGSSSGIRQHLVQRSFRLPSPGRRSFRGERAAQYRALSRNCNIFFQSVLPFRPADNLVGGARIVHTQNRFGKYLNRENFIDSRESLFRKDFVGGTRHGALVGHVAALGRHLCHTSSRPVCAIGCVKWALPVPLAPAVRRSLHRRAISRAFEVARAMLPVRCRDGCSRLDAAPPIAPAVLGRGRAMARTYPAAMTGGPGLACGDPWPHHYCWQLMGRNDEAGPRTSRRVSLQVETERPCFRNPLPRPGGRLRSSARWWLRAW